MYGLSEQTVHQITLLRLHTRSCRFVPLRLSMFVARHELRRLLGRFVLLTGAIGLLVVLFETSALAPFIYAIF